MGINTAGLGEWAGICMYMVAFLCLPLLEISFWMRGSEPLGTAIY